MKGETCFLLFESKVHLPYILLTSLMCDAGAGTVLEA